MSSIREYYETIGVEEYYREYSSQYNNPHYETIIEIMDYINRYYDIGNTIMDLCCGGGEITLTLDDKKVIGIDPYTYELYKKQTGNECLKLSFKDIACGNLETKVDTIICSFALHLCEESLLPTVLWQLGMLSNKLIVISPHKRPDCDGISGWKLKNTVTHNRITAKIYLNDTFN